MMKASSRAAAVYRFELQPDPIPVPSVEHCTMSDTMQNTFAAVTRYPVASSSHLARNGVLTSP
eukprot:625091-Hanusia_phi.AAC.1